MNDAALELCLRKRRIDRLFYACKSVSADDENVFYTAIFQLIQNPEPVLGALIFADMYGQNLLVTGQADSQDHIRSELPDLSVITNGEVDCINENDGINRIKWAFLPILDLRKKAVCDVRNHAVADLKTVDILDRLADLTGRHAFGVQRNDLLLDAGNVFLTLFYDFRLKTPVTILRNFDLSFAEIAANLLWFLAIAIIGIVGTLILVIAEMFIHFRLQHLLDRTSEKVFQRILDILCRLDIILLKQHSDDVFLSFAHCFSFSSSHN